MVDEPTGVSKHGSSVLYLRLLMGGTFVTVFWRIVQVSDASAVGLFSLIESTFEEDRIPKWLLFSFASDGASVMTGSNGGVAVLLQQSFNMFCMVCHCIAHRHALAAASAAKANAVCQYFESVLCEVIGYHSHSTKRHEHLENLQAQLGLAKLRMVRLVATRWLSRGQAVARVFAIIAALVMEFKEDERDQSNALAGPLVEATQSFVFVVCLSLFNDILQTLCQLSMAFQKDHVKFSEVKVLLAATRECLQAQYVDEPFVGGPSYRDTQRDIESAMRRAPRPYVPVPALVPFNHRGVAIPTVDGERHDWIKAGMKQYAEDLLADLDGRFPDVPLFTALSIFDFTTMPEEEEWKDAKATWGNLELEELIVHFGAPKIAPGVRGKVFSRIIDPTLVRAQWDTLKHVLFSLKQEGVSLEDGYRKVLASDSLPDVKRLAFFFLVLCLSTVWCERGFSLMAQIKTKLRNCMNIETLDALMMISSNGPKLSDKEAILKLIDESFAHWLARQKRCLARSHPGVKRPRHKQTRKKTVPLHELLQSQARAARDARTEFDSSDDEHSSADESEGEEGDGSNAAATGDGDGDDGRMMDQRTTEEIQTSHGPFNPPPGWAILPKPAPTAAEWVDMTKTFKKGHGFWRGKRIAHIFNDGWDIRTFQQREKLHLVFFYSSDSTKFAHSLSLDDWGGSKVWVIVAKESE